VRAIFEGATPQTLVLAVVILGLLLAALAVALSKIEFGQEARSRRQAQRAMATARARRQAPTASRGSGELSPADLARLDVFRPRARLMAGEPTGLPGWWRKLQLIWRDGHAGWIIASLVGAFSMATHFGAFWLIAGGGWLGATVITILSTLVMVAACLWILMGLLSR
jgi:hypothetical protein